MSVTRQYINRRWELHCDKDEGETVHEKKRFAYRIWREDFRKSKKREDGKESEIKSNWTDIYQLIGFDNVFQGVWFQGVTQLAERRGCSFSAIPIILSVLVSLATILGVQMKLSKVRDLEVSLQGDRLYTKALQSYISACEREGVNFDFHTIEDKAGMCDIFMKNDFDKVSAESKKKRIILLVTLTIASILFGWLIHLIMCGKYF